VSVVDLAGDDHVDAPGRGHLVAAEILEPKGSGLDNPDRVAVVEMPFEANVAPLGPQALHAFESLGLPYPDVFRHRPFSR